MRAVMLEVPRALLDDRRAKGLDKSDEMWEGELDPETRRVELFANRDGRMEPVDPVQAQALDVGADTIDGVLARI